MEPVKASECSCIHFHAPSDPNGNPQRVYVVIHLTEGFVAAVDEGFDGNRALGNAFGKDIGEGLRIRLAGGINIPRKQYHELLKDYGPNGPRRKELK